MYRHVYVHNFRGFEKHIIWTLPIFHFVSLMITLMYQWLIFRSKHIICYFKDAFWGEKIFCIDFHIADVNKEQIITKAPQSIVPQYFFSLVNGDIKSLLNIYFTALVWKTLVPPLERGVREDYLWCRMTERVVTGVPDRCLECTLTALLSHIPW